MSTFVGLAKTPKTPAKPKSAPAVPEVQRKVVGADAKTRAELVEEAEELGIDVPKGATKAQIQKLIDEAPVM